MLKCIQSLRGFGIFDAYDQPARIKPFSDRNVIYGWNYSGKTTLSRLFRMLDQRAISEHFVGARFSIRDHAEAVVDEACLTSCTKKVRVFNTDFIEESLNWNGKAFNPILLLGSEAVDAQNKIAHYEGVIKRCNASAAAYRRKAAAIDENLSEQRTTAARRIKETLNLVETFTATHLNMLLGGIAARPDPSYTLPQDQITSDLSLATASEKDRLPDVAPLKFNDTALAIHAELTAVLPHIPASSRVLDALRDNPELAQWVSAGMRLHDHSRNCQFCLQPLTDQRLAELKAHFSQEVTDQRARLEKLRDDLEQTMAPMPDIRQGDVNPQFRRTLNPLIGYLAIHATALNNWVQTARGKISQKINEPFRAIGALSDPAPYIIEIIGTITKLNDLIRESNAISANFATARTDAIDRLKSHYAQQFRVDHRLDEVDAAKARFTDKARKFTGVANKVSGKMAQEQAKINRAQQGREKINERITQLLVGTALQIEARRDPDGDKFYLMRGRRIARHLSEGEKTAIAFAYFLTKLLEDGDLADVIVYIDDPISSLDSNHIFQVYSLIKTTFFQWVKPDNAKGDWRTTCKQLFVSTHNFEFFQLLYELPGTIHFYQTKRIGAERSTFTDLPPSVSRYRSEYHYLFHEFHTSPDKSNPEHLLALPNAARRFIELYTYAKLPLGRKSEVNDRAQRLFGPESSARIMKVFHHFSHLQSIERLMQNTELVADIEGAVAALMDHLAQDAPHYEALIDAVNRSE